MTIQRDEKCSKLTAVCFAETDIYSHILSNHPDDPPSIKIADPLFMNPNSYENLTLVLRKVGQDAGVERYGEEQRKWTIVCCDGLPYHMLMQIIQETRVCSICSQSFMGKDLFRKHFTSSHDDENAMDFYYEFD